MDQKEQAEQLRGVNLYNWTQQAWDEETRNPNLVGAKKWNKLETGFQRYLLAKTQGCTTKNEVKNILETN